MLSFTNNPGNLFNRLGRLAGLILQMRAYQATLNSILTGATTGEAAQLATEPDLQSLIGGGYLGQLSVPEAIATFGQGIAPLIVNRMVFRDNPQYNQNLQTTNIVASITEVIRQMKGAGATVLAMTVSTTPTLFTANVANVGNGVVVCSTKRPSDGLVLELMLAETMKATCTGDSYIGGQTAGNELFNVTGAGSEPDQFAFDWPLGSNANISLNAINGDADNSQGNLLTNSGFNTFTVANVPDNWTITVGSPGQQVFSNGSIVFSGANSLQFTGDSVTNVTLQQQFGVDTASTLSALTQYAWNGWLRRDGIASSQGTLQIALVDANGAVINDAAGNPNSFNIDLTGLNTVFTAYNVAFRTPEIMPSVIYLRIQQTVPLQSGRSVYIDKTSLGTMTPAYTTQAGGPLGPYVAIFSGSTNFIQAITGAQIGDFTTIAVTNSRGAGGTLNTWQTAWALLLPDSVNNNFLLPSSASPTISDSLIF